MDDSESDCDDFEVRKPPAHELTSDQMKEAKQALDQIRVPGTAAVRMIKSDTLGDTSACDCTAASVVGSKLTALQTRSPAKGAAGSSAFIVHYRRQSVQYTPTPTREIHVVDPPDVALAQLSTWALPQAQT